MSNPLLARFSGEPTLVAPEAHERFEACLRVVMADPKVSEILRETAVAGDGFWPEAGSWRSYYRPYVVVDGVLQIPVKGVLLHDFSMAYGSYATGYVYIQKALERGLSDPGVKGIAFLCDSPGGEVAGNFDLVDVIHAARGRKPMRAFAHESAYSAAYSIASAADRIWVARTGGVGSIGVVVTHVDRSAATAAAGLKVTFIHAGAHKVDGNPYQALPEAVRERMQSRIDGLYGVFVSTVARNRGMPEKAVRATQALTFTAAEATANGLADGIGSLEDAVSAFVAELSGGSQDTRMSAPIASAPVMTPPIAPAATTATVTTAALDAARAEGAATAKARIRAIIGSEVAEGRAEFAAYLAFDSDMTAAAAVAALAKAPKIEPPAAGRLSLADEMRLEVQFSLGGDTPGDPATMTEAGRGAAAAKALLGLR